MVRRPINLLRFIIPLAILIVLIPLVPYAGDNERDAFVRYVVDGDTIKIAGRETVRYVGIDTPELGEPLYREAKERNRALVSGKKIRLVVCEEEKRDKYGRLLAWVYVRGTFVNETLLKEGLARRLSIPPCGRKFDREFRAAEQYAKKKGIGLWAFDRGNGAYPPF